MTKIDREKNNEVCSQCKKNLHKEAQVKANCFLPRTEEIWSTMEKFVHFRWKY